MIKIQNIYHMLAYAFQVLNEQGYKSVATEHFENVAELCAAILTKGMQIQIKRGLGKDYISETDTLSGICGRIDINNSIKRQSILKRQLVCTYDEFSENTYSNQVIKTTLIKLLHSDIASGRKKDIKKVLVYLSNVDEVDSRSIRWGFQYNRNNQTYRMLISICYLVMRGLLQTTASGETKLMQFIDEQRMCRLYEKFILEFYKKEYPMLNVSSSRIPWALDDDVDEMLPVMQSDIMLSHGNKILIIDAKYYSRTTQEHFDNRTIHSVNLYQMFTYVKNKEASINDSTHTVSGMLLYAETDSRVQPDQTYSMSGNRISVKTLNLDCDFGDIASSLDKVVAEFFSEDSHKVW